jgi:hypothetical protein
VEYGSDGVNDNEGSPSKKSKVKDEPVEDDDEDTFAY